MSTEQKHYVSSDDPATVRAWHASGRLTPEELFPSDSNGHKFKKGDRCKLLGLVDFPDLNGQSVTISSPREDGPRGRCYYIKGECSNLINWVYEYGLKLETTK